MKPVNIGGHPAYQDHVLTQLCKYYPDADTSLDAAAWGVMEQFWNLDLSSVDQIMQDRYSVFGPQPRLPSDMLRSYLHLDNIYFSRFIRPMNPGRQAHDSESLLVGLYIG